MTETDYTTHEVDETQLDPAAGLDQINIEAPEIRGDYAPLILAKVEELFADEAVEKILLGVNISHFTSRREEHQMYQVLRQKGFLPTNLYTAPTEDYFRLLVTRK